MVHSYGRALAYAGLLRGVSTAVRVGCKEVAAMGDPVTKKVERVQVRGKPIKVSDFVSPFFDDDDELDALIASAAAAAQARGDTLLHGLLTAVEPAEDEE